MTSYKYIISLLFVVLSLISCEDNKNISDNRLEIALEASGTNRNELEKVLKYYSTDPKDSLKLKATEFLISNMTYHTSLCGDYIDRHIEIVDSLFSTIPLPLRSIIYTIPSGIDSLKPYIKTEFDIEKISADFLIKNIDYSFRIWENAMYEPKISFDDFCEYILPYKFGNEPLVLWKDSIVQDYKSYRDLNTYRLKMSELSLLKNMHFTMMEYTQFKDPNLFSYVQTQENTASKFLVSYRSSGIPTAIDFIPFADIKDYNNSFWSTIICDKYLNSNNTYLGKKFFAKVFRKTYSINPIPDDKDNFVPDFIKNPYNKDVTDIYQNTSVVDYDFGDLPSNVKYAYLAVFYDGDWRELSWSKLKNGKASFKNMGRDIIYMPIYYNGTERVCADNPILVRSNGNVCDIGIVGSDTQNLKINRVSTYKVEEEYAIRSIVGSQIAGCSDTLNIKFDTLAQINHYKHMQFDTVNINSDKKYKHWFLLTPEYVSIAEIKFFNEKGDEINGVAYMINRRYMIDRFNIDLNNINNLFDNNALTHFSTIAGFGISFEKPISVSKISYMLKYSESGIIPNNKYELFYFNSGKWVSLGEKIATGYDIEFENIPVGALLWLHDYGKKCEERPFTIVNGKIKFW